MSKRYWIMETNDGPGYGKHPEIIHDFTAPSIMQAVTAFRTLYGEQPQYVLFQQVACSEPAGSCDEADNSGGADSVHEIVSKVFDEHRSMDHPPST